MPISVLLLGTENAGKTEVGHALSTLPRIDFGPTKGVHVFNVNSKFQHIKLTEVGGSDSVRDIWPHYYNDAFGIIFVIDCSLQAPFDKMREILQNLMHNKFIRGKPLLIVANKQDLDQSIDVVDITYFFRIDELCNLLGTPCNIVTSSIADRSDLQIGMEWLVDTIVDNYKSLKNRNRFNGLLTTPIKRFKRERTSLPKKAKRFEHNRRISSAPSKIASERAIKAQNGYINTVKIQRRVQQILPSKTVVHSPEPSSSMFRLNTILLHHE
ncbi:ADP-ribosylation factor 1-like isoform X2 [Contarinia nasturtii]|uniref:ADP-ribosylation factor 1-like isoform X2 n=1 Tax=Contarinia nasturtii TaxID=265458 RepID=UPI0012D3FD12|nr:ADP-ribosylation factor 1-like isoform X2 [Contarinia nasturtii]